MREPDTQAGHGTDDDCCPEEVPHQAAPVPTLGSRADATDPLMGPGRGRSVVIDRVLRQLVSVRVLRIIDGLAIRVQSHIDQGGG